MTTIVPCLYLVTITNLKKKYLHLIQNDQVACGINLPNCDQISVRISFDLCYGLVLRKVSRMLVRIHIPLVDVAFHIAADQHVVHFVRSKPINTGGRILHRFRF